MWHIVLLAELFTAESKAQVYGCLHELLEQNPVALNNIGKSHPYIHTHTIKPTHIQSLNIDRVVPTVVGTDRYSNK